MPWKSAVRLVNVSWGIPSAVFILTVAPQTKHSLSNKFTRHLGTMHAKDAHLCFVHLYRFIHRCESSLDFFIRPLQKSDAFHKSSFFLHYLTLLHDGEQMQQLLVRASFSSVLALRGNLSHSCVSRAVMISCISLPPACWICAQAKYAIKLIL